MLKKSKYSEMGKKPNRVVRYRIENEKFLEQMAQEEGIVALERRGTACGVRN